MEKSYVLTWDVIEIFKNKIIKIVNCDLRQTLSDPHSVIFQWHVALPPLLLCPQVHCSCPKKCSCPSPAPSCPPGISSVLDGCGCCKVCARQFNQDCSTSEPCDHIKGLHCHLGAGGDPDRGLCRGECVSVFSIGKCDSTLYLYNIFATLCNCF